MKPHTRHCLFILFVGDLYLWTSEALLRCRIFWTRQNVIILYLRIAREACYWRQSEIINFAPTVSSRNSLSACRLQIWYTKRVRGCTNWSFSGSGRRFQNLFKPLRRLRARRIYFVMLSDKSRSLPGTTPRFSHCHYCLRINLFSQNAKYRHDYFDKTLKSRGLETLLLLYTVWTFLTVYTI